MSKRWSTTATGCALVTLIGKNFTRMTRRLSLTKQKKDDQKPSSNASIIARDHRASLDAHETSPRSGAEVVTTSLTLRVGVSTQSNHFFPRPMIRWMAMLAARLTA